MATGSPPPAQHLLHDAEAAGSSLPPLLIEADRLANTIIAGVHGRRRAGMGETFWQFRPYVAGDVSTQIDWRRSARATNRLYIRQQESEITATAWLWCDPGKSMAYASSTQIPTKKLRAQVLATALCTLLARAGERIGYAGLMRPPFIGRNAAERFAEALVTTPVSDENRLPPFVTATGEQRCVFLSDFFVSTDALTERFKALADQGIKAVLMQVNDPAEEDYPFSGRQEFLPANTAEPAVLFGDAAVVAKQYRELFAGHRKWLRDQCRHYGWPLIVHRTDHTAETALIALYRAMAREALV